MFFCCISTSIRKEYTRKKWFFLCFLSRCAGIGDLLLPKSFGARDFWSRKHNRWGTEVPRSDRSISPQSPIWRVNLTFWKFPIVLCQASFQVALLSAARGGLMAGASSRDSTHSRRPLDCSENSKFGSNCLSIPEIRESYTPDFREFACQLSRFAACIQTRIAVLPHLYFRTIL